MTIDNIISLMLGIWLGQFAGGLLVVLTVYILAWIHEKKMPLKISSLICQSFGERST